MFTSRTGYIGIDFGTCALKVAQIEKSAGRIRLLAAAVTKRGSHVDTLQWLRTAPTSSATEFAKAIQASRFRGRKTACTAPAGVCDIRIISTDEESDSAVLASIGQQLSQIHNIPANKIYFDYWQSPFSQPGELNVLSIADRWGKQLLQDHQENSMACEIIDGLPHALTKAATLVPDFDSNQPLLLLDWGARSTSICICVAAQPVYTRTLQDEGFAIVENRISNAMAVTTNEASQLLSEFGLPNGDVQPSEVQAISDEIMSPMSANLFDEIFRTISFLKSQQADLSIRQGLVFGAGATTNNIGPWLSNKLGISMQPWNCFEKGGTNASGWPVELLGPAIAASSQKWSAA